MQEAGHQVADLLVKARRELGQSQKIIAQKLNISPSIVGYWETGDTLPPSARIDDISRVYQLDADELRNTLEISKKRKVPTYKTENREKGANAR